MAEVRKAKNVIVHMRAEGQEFLGRDRLEGVRIDSKEQRPVCDIAVEGVFLEIGLTPNSDPVRDLLALNAAGEIPVTREQATGVAGLFAAGDVTDEREKQIIVAAGTGARAALSADRYLSNQALASTPAADK